MAEQESSFPQNVTGRGYTVCDRVVNGLGVATPIHGNDAMFDANRKEKS